MIKRIKKILFLIGLLLGGGLFFYQFYKAVISFVNANITIHHPYLLVVCLLLEIIVYFNQMLIWGEVMNGIGKKLVVKTYFSGYWLSYLPRYLPGTVWGYMSRGAWLNRAFQIDYKTSTVGSIIEIIVMAFSAIIVFLFSNEHNKLLIGIIMLLEVIGVWFIIKRFSHWFSNNSFYKFLQFLDFNSIDKKFSLADWIRSIFYALLNWIVFGLITILIIFSLTNMPFMSLMKNYLDVCGIYALSWVIGFLVFFVPSGLGIREYLLSSMLMMTFTIPLETSSTISVVLRLLGFMAEFFWIGTGLYLEGQNKYRKFRE